MATPRGKRIAPGATKPFTGVGTYLVLAVTAGLLIRLVIALLTAGTTDATHYLRFGARVEMQGLLEAYRQDSELNHPPIVTLWAWLAYRITDGEVPFFFLFKLPIIAFEGFTCWLLYRIARDRTQSTVATLSAAAGYALSLAAILVSSFHCNTDTVYAGLAILSVWLLDSRHRPLAAGLALGAAVNIKLIPVLLIPGMVLGLRTRREGCRFVAGLAVGVLPFLPILWTVGRSYYENAIAYGSNLDKWGIQAWLLLHTGELPFQSEMGAAFSYYRWGKWPMLAAIVAWSVTARMLPRWNRFEVAFVSLTIFLVLTPGFGTQYVAMVVPLMFVARPAWAHLYSLLAGAFIAAVYWSTLQPSSDQPSWPLYSAYNSLFKQPAPWIGLAAWASLLMALIVTLVRGSTQGQTATSARRA